MAVSKLMEILTADCSDPAKFAAYEGAAEVMQIMENVNAVSDGNIRIEFDITLVRGQGYYTGCVFEVRSEEFGGTIAGGGRYDGLIGRFSGKLTPAVGFSIGFERIFTILTERKVKADRPETCAVLYNEGEVVRALKFARSLKGKYDVSIIPKKNKLGKQLSRLEESGFFCAAVLGESDEWKTFG